MSKSKKSKNIVLIILAVILLLGACFGAVALYARNEINKPKFTLPEEEPRKSITELPKDKASVCAYIEKLYAEAISADDVEGSWRTDARIEGDISSSLSEADMAVINYIKDNASGQLSGLYAKEDNLVMSEAKEKPELVLESGAITEFTAEQGKTDDEGNVTNDDLYYISFTVNPESADTEEIKESEIYDAICDKFSSALTVDDTDITVKAITYNFVIDRIYDNINSVEINKEYEVSSKVTFKDLYSSLNNDDNSFDFVYHTTEYINFRHYGARFTERSIAVSENDMRALPASVTVKSDATAEDYELIFDVSDKNAVSIDEDGVMTVENLTDEPVTVKMTLKYDGHEYTDELIVYITELEVETNG